MDIIEKLNQKARLARQLGNHVPDNPIIAKLNARARRRKAADAWPESNPHTANTCATAPETSSSQSTDKERSSSATSVDGADAASTEERRNETLPPGGLLQAGDSAEAPNAYNANTMNNKRQRRAAVLPWMRVPVSVDAGSGVPLCDVGSLLPVRLGGVIN